MKTFDLSKEKFNNVPEDLREGFRRAGARYTDRIAKMYDERIDTLARVFGLDREVVEYYFGEGM